MPRSVPTDQGNSLETQATLHLLSDVERDSFLSQRRFAMRFGIAVGLTNAYVKRCIKKGWIKMNRVPARRYAYYLTPKGFSEKSRLVADYLYGSLDFFRTARRQCVEALHECERQGWRRVALAGDSELAEIATLAARETGVELVAVVAPGRNEPEFAGLPVVAGVAALDDVDALLVTDINDPQAVYDGLADEFSEARIITLPVLHISRNGPPQRRARRA